MTRWLRRIAWGFAATISVLAVASFGFLFATEQYYRLYSRTVDVRQFRTGAEWWEQDLATIRSFEARHGLDPEANDGLRLVIDEWPEWKYLLSYHVEHDGALNGAILASPYDDKGPTYERDFHLEVRQTRLFLDSFDRQIDGFWGATTRCVDGTGFQFERWNNKLVSSGHGNAACQLHYAELMSLVGESLVDELKDVPFKWGSWFASKRELSLLGIGE